MIGVCVYDWFYEQPYNHWSYLAKAIFGSTSVFSSSFEHCGLLVKKQKRSQKLLSPITINESGPVFFFGFFFGFFFCSVTENREIKYCSSKHCIHYLTWPVH